MKPLIEALIGRHNVENADSISKCVYVSDASKNCVWIFLSMEDAQKRYNNKEIRNDSIKEVLKRNIIGIWVQPTDAFLENPNASRNFYVRGATGDYKKDFKSLYDSRSIKPKIKEFTPKMSILPNMKIIDYYNQSNWFRDEVSKL